MQTLSRKLLAVLLVLVWSQVTTADDAIVRSKHLPSTTPWNLKDLSKAPAFEWVDREGPVHSLLYSGEPYAGQPTRVFAYYASPGTLAGDMSKDEKLPAVVLIHGGGGTAFREWAELWARRGYAAIAMDLAGHRPIEGRNPHDRKNRTRLDDGGPDQEDDEKFGSIEKEPGEQWPYHAVANVIRAHSLVRSFQGVDANRTAVTGISWGGYLTCIVAGVDSRFKAAVPVYGCGFLHENSVWLARFAKMTEEQRERWVTLWDPSRYLPAVSMPILFVNGTNDFAYPLDSYMKSFDAVPGERQLCVTVNMPHSHPAGWKPQEIGAFIDHHLLREKPLPMVCDAGSADGKASAIVRSSVKIARASLHYTTDTNEINKRKWMTIEATLNDASLTARAPEDATAWFVTVQDERGLTVSSRVIFPRANDASEKAGAAIDATSPLMLDLPSIGSDETKIDFARLPKLPGKHVMISDVRDAGGTRVNQHTYLARFADRYWAMWSDGPGVPQRGAKDHRNVVPGHDQADTRVSYAVSDDGVKWSKPASLSGPPRIEGFGWIARGFWIRDGQLLALASHFHAPGYPGKGLSLEAFRWDDKQNEWLAHGRVFDDAMNNFPPKRLPTGQWMMTRRDHERQVSVMVGGDKAFDQWTVQPMAAYDGNGRPEEPYWYLLPDSKTIVGLIRDNGGSKRLLRTFSTDNGRTWSPLVRTNFPDATSKFFSLRTSRGYYVLVSNSNPRKRDPLTLAVSHDGLVYRHLFLVIGGRHIDYPHVIEHDGQLLIAFSGAKQTMEVVKVSLSDLDEMIAKNKSR